jgi:hypothetical protein
MTTSCHVTEFKNQLMARFKDTIPALNDHQMDKLYGIARGITWTNDGPTMWLFLDENPYLMAYLYHQANLMGDGKGVSNHGLNGHGLNAPWITSGWGFFFGSLWSVAMQHLDPSVGYSLVAMLGAMSLGWKKWCQWRAPQASLSIIPWTKPHSLTPTKQDPLSLPHDKGDLS